MPALSLTATNLHPTSVGPRRKTSSNGQAPGLELNHEQNCRLTGVHEAPRPTAKYSWKLQVLPRG